MEASSEGPFYNLVQEVKVAQEVKLRTLWLDKSLIVLNGNVN
jgi:hypothetical protein